MRVPLQLLLLCTAEVKCADVVFQLTSTLGCGEPNKQPCSLSAVTPPLLGVDIRKLSVFEPFSTVGVESSQSLVQPQTSGLQLPTCDRIITGLAFKSSTEVGAAALQRQTEKSAAPTVCINCAARLCLVQWLRVQLKEHSDCLYDEQQCNNNSNAAKKSENMLVRTETPVFMYHINFEVRDINDTQKPHTGARPNAQYLPILTQFLSRRPSPTAQHSLEVPIVVLYSGLDKKDVVAYTVPLFQWPWPATIADEEEHETLMNSKLLAEWQSRYQAACGNPQSVPLNSVLLRRVSFINGSPIIQIEDDAALPSLFRHVTAFGLSSIPFDAIKYLPADSKSPEGFHLQTVPQPFFAFEQRQALFAWWMRGAQEGAPIPGQLPGPALSITELAARRIHGCTRAPYHTQSCGACAFPRVSGQLPADQLFKGTDDLLSILSDRATDRRHALLTKLARTIAARPEFQQVLGRTLPFYEKFVSKQKKPVPFS